MPEDAEEDPGGFMPVNSDFDEQNATSSGDPMLDNQPHTGTGHRIVANDAELRQATLYFSAPDGVGSGTWTLTYSPKLLLWEWATDRWRILPSGISRTENMPIAKTLIVEGLEHSAALRDAGISAAAGGDSDFAKLTVVGVDGDVDSDNDDGLEDPARNNAEESLEDKASEPAKVLAVNDGDADGDGIPDFADGYNLYGADSAELADVSFIPYILDLRGIAFSAQARFGFFYDQIIPHQVTRTGSGTTQDPYLYTPASGLLRLWTKNAHERTTSELLRDGGQFVAPYVEYSLSDFTDGDVEEVTPGVFRLWLEAVRPALTGVQWVHVFADPDGPGSAAGYDISDMVLVTPIATRFVEPTEDGTDTQPAATLTYSVSRPDLVLTYYSLSQVRPSADGLKILGDIVISGQVDSAVADVVRGDLGRIDQVDVYVNGGVLPIGAIVAPELNATKAENLNSFNKPWDFSATFSKTFYGVELRPGDNVLTVTASDKVFGQSGYASASIPLTATPPANPPPVDPSGNRIFTNDQFSQESFELSGQSDPGELRRYLIEILGPASVLDNLGHLETSGGRYTIAQARNSRYYLAAINQDVDRAIGMVADFGNQAQVQLFPGDPIVQNLGNGLSRLTYRLDKLVGVHSSVLGNRYYYEHLETFEVDVPTDSAAVFQQYIRVLIERIREFDALGEKERERALAEFALRVVPFGSLSIDINDDNVTAETIKTAGLDSLLTFSPMALARPLRVASVGAGTAERSVAASYRTVLRGNSETISTTFGERAASIADGGFTNLGNPRVATVLPSGLASNGLRTVDDAISINVGELNGFWRQLTPARLHIPPTQLATFVDDLANPRVITADYEIMYRVYGGTAERVGSFMSRIRPTTRQQAIEIFGLDPSWGEYGTIYCRGPSAKRNRHLRGPCKAARQSHRARPPNLEFEGVRI